VPSAQFAVDALTEFYDQVLPNAKLIPTEGHVFDFEYYPKGAMAAMSFGLRKREIAKALYPFNIEDMSMIELLSLFNCYNDNRKL
jgi:hypothetical protein